MSVLQLFACAAAIASPEGPHQCTDLAFEKAVQTRSSFGGKQFCCSPCGKDICCPSKSASGEDVTLRLDGKDPYHIANLCHNCKGGGKCANALKLDGVQTKGPSVTLEVTNVSEYAPSWPIVNASKPGKLVPGQQGYLFNGMKSDHKLAKDLVQINLCANRYVKTRMCFRNRGGDKVRMERASIRIFDVNHYRSHFDQGPGAFQFNCSGGTFSVFGDHPYMNSAAGPPVIVEENVTWNGQSKSTYVCPEDDEPVTMWSKAGAERKPTSAALDALSPKMESSMVLINFANVDCFDVTLGNMPPKYHQQAWRNPSNDQDVSVGYDLNLNARTGGNPLNGTAELSARSFPDLQSGPCAPSSSGRNWLIAGWADRSGVSAPCSTVAISNDPMFVVNGLHRHFWLPTGQMTPLLEWKGPAGGHQYILSGETFGHGPTQWFRSYVVRAEGQEVLRVSISETLPVRAEETALRATNLNRQRKLRTVNVWVDTKPVSAIGKPVESARVKGVSVLPKLQPIRLIGSAHAENVEIHAPGLALSITSARANKYGTAEQQVRWAHLNMKMLSRLPESAKGLMPELAGMLPMSKQTKAFLNVPKAVQEHRSEMLDQRASAEEDRRPERLRASQQLARFADRAAAAKPDQRSGGSKTAHRAANARGGKTHSKKHGVLMA